MKFGCAKDIDLLYLSGDCSVCPVDDSISTTISQACSMLTSSSQIISEPCSITSSFNLSESSLNMSYVDRAVLDIMGSENPYNPEYSRNIMKFLMSSLHDQISALKSENAFLRVESNVKNSTIGQLFNELSNLRGTVRPFSPSSDSSVDLDNLMTNPVESTIHDD